MDVEYDIKGLVLGAYAEWGSNGGNKSFQKWLEENPNVVRALLTNSLDNMATAAVGKKTDEARIWRRCCWPASTSTPAWTARTAIPSPKALQK